MISYYLGIPGSGKSYAGIDIIFNNFSDHPDAKQDLKKNYINCYTNINGMKFDKLNSVYPYDHDEIYRSLAILHTAYKQKKTDAELIEIAKDHNIYRSLFVIDESHNFFNSPSPVLIWWLTYHRHLYHDIILITQNLSLIDSKYKPLAEFFFKAKSTSLTLFSGSFIYTVYIDSRFSKGSKAGEKKVSKRKEVFDLYVSGDSVEGKNIILKYIKMSAGILVLLLIGFFGFISSKTPDAPADTPPAVSVGFDPSKINPNSTTGPTIKADAELGSRLCVLECNNESCTFEKKDLPLDAFLRLTDIFNLEVIHIEKSKHTKKIFFLAGSLFLNLFKKDDPYDTSPGPTDKKFAFPFGK